MKTRTLKVEQMTRFTLNTTRPIHYPAIRLKGNWMREAGINPGMMVNVEVSQNQIIIKKTFI